MVRLYLSAAKSEREVIRLKSGFGPAGALAKIRPPGRSYADWHRFLDECVEAGVAALIKTPSGETTTEWRTPFGFGLLRRWRWLEESERMGIPYEQAERAFEAAMERDSRALAGAMLEQEQRRQRAMREREAQPERERGRRNGKPLMDAAEADSLAREVGLL